MPIRSYCTGQGEASACCTRGASPPADASAATASSPPAAAASVPPPAASPPESSWFGLLVAPLPLARSPGVLRPAAVTLCCSPLAAPPPAAAAPPPLAASSPPAAAASSLGTTSLLVAASGVLPLPPGVVPLSANPSASGPSDLRPSSSPPAYDFSSILPVSSARCASTPGCSTRLAAKLPAPSWDRVHRAPKAVITSSTPTSGVTLRSLRGFISPSRG